ncbi:hypothetical protein HZF02_13270 [Pseudomonas yamanorum]|nr:hypothetical protein HZF02_13270 [Pseudomonas yamanorum]
MIVKRCEWISTDAQEAELTIGDDDVECMAFSHPCYMRVGDCLREPLFAISIRDVTRAELSSQLFIRRQNNGFVHEIMAEVVDIKRRLVVVDPISIELDDVLPGDIRVGDVIQFSCGRLDVIS